LFCFVLFCVVSVIVMDKSKTERGGNVTFAHSHNFVFIFLFLRRLGREGWATGLGKATSGVAEKRAKKEGLTVTATG